MAALQGETVETALLAGCCWREREGKAGVHVKRQSQKREREKRQPRLDHLLEVGARRRSAWGLRSSDNVWLLCSHQQRQHQYVLSYQVRSTVDHGRQSRRRKAQSGDRG